MTGKNHTPFWFIIAGGVLIFFWVLCNAIQVQTSEVWISQHFGSINFFGGLSVYGQLGVLVSGSLTPQQVVSWMFAYIVQASYMFCAVEVEIPDNRRSKLLWLAIAALILLNTAGDANYAATSGFNLAGQVGFSLAMFVGSFGFGWMGFHLLHKGVKLAQA